MELRVLVSIWGSAFADVFLRWSLPSLLSDRNCRRILARGYHLTFYIYSDSTTLEYLRSSEVTTSAEGKQFNFFSMSETSFDDKPLDYGVKNNVGEINTHELQSRCYMHGMEQLMEGELVFLFWTADFVLSDGSLDWAMQQINNGQNAYFEKYSAIFTHTLVLPVPGGPCKNISALFNAIPLNDQTQKLSIGHWRNRRSEET